MARNWQYPRWRRLLMQSAMWIILGATVGLAAFVDRQRAKASFVVLGPMVRCDGIQLRLPAGWLTQAGAFSPGLLTATENGPPHTIRRLEVTAVNASFLDGVVRKLFQNQANTPAAPQRQSTNGRQSVPMSDNETLRETIPFGPNHLVDGELFAREAAIEDPEGNTVPLVHIVIATAKLPGGPDVTLRITHVGEPAEEGEDVDLIKRVAATVTPAGDGQKQE